MKYAFRDDYSETAHPDVLAALQAIAREQNASYGNDRHSAEAAGLIKQQIKNDNVDVHFVSGGTQANLVLLSTTLRPYQAVIAAKTGHIAVHEAGAIEATGHKIIEIDTEQGKLTPDQVQAAVDEHTDEHMVKPKIVFISQSTELGTVYSKAELESLKACCRQNDLYLHIDGARLGIGVTCAAADVNMADIAGFADVFYIGGTKNGGLFGEAIVIVNDSLKPDFRYQLKQRGALLAKGQAVGAQFAALFTNDLYFDLAKHANDMAAKLAAGIKQAGYKFLSEPCTNQIFPILPHDLIKRLEADYDFYVWQAVDGQSSAVRLVTSWATVEEEVDKFVDFLRN